MKRLAIYLLLMLLLAASVSPVLAHGYIERTDPADGAELDAPPQTLRVWFNEPLVPDSGQIRVTSGAGETITPLDVRHAPDDNALLIAEMPQGLPQGAYIDSASAVVVSDGHEPVGSIVFWVGARQQAAAEATNTPQYSLLALFLGVMSGLGGLGWWVNRRAGLAVERPADWQNIHHTPLT